MDGLKGRGRQRVSRGLEQARKVAQGRGTRLAKTNSVRPTHPKLRLRMWPCEHRAWAFGKLAPSKQGGIELRRPKSKLRSRWEKPPIPFYINEFIYLIYLKHVCSSDSNLFCKEVWRLIPWRALSWSEWGLVGGKPKRPGEMSLPSRRISMEVRVCIWKSIHGALSAVRQGANLVPKGSFRMAF